MAGNKDNKNSNHNNHNNSGKLNFSAIVVGIGVLLVAFGVWQLAERFLGALYEDIWHIVNAVISVAWPLVTIGLGIGLMVAARKGNLNLPNNKKLFRSTRNKKFAGVCGGIAEYLSADAALVRVVTIVLGFLSWYVIVPLYILFWIIIPTDTKNYNNWV
jgi:phage shock protein PspC (stress-responsive transcriptional regulator)